MNRLMRDTYDPEQTRGRSHRLRRNITNGIIRYTAPNGMLFEIDTRPIDEGGDPEVKCDAAKIYSASHKTHTLGDGRVCLATSLRGWDLTRILLQCDSWARGMEIYKKTGRFPKDPLESFRTSSSRREEPKKKSFWEALFG